MGGWHAPLTYPIAHATWDHLPGNPVGHFFLPTVHGLGFPHCTANRRPLLSELRGPPYDLLDLDDHFLEARLFICIHFSTATSSVPSAHPLKKLDSSYGNHTAVRKNANTTRRTAAEAEQSRTEEAGNQHQKPAPRRAGTQAKQQTGQQTEIPVL